MLVLSRKLGQSFLSGPDVRVTIVKIDRNSVRIGIEAPGDVAIQREEIVFELPQFIPGASRGRLKTSIGISRECWHWMPRRVPLGLLSAD